MIHNNCLVAGLLDCPIQSFSGIEVGVSGQDGNFHFNWFLRIDRFTWSTSIKNLPFRSFLPKSIGFFIFDLSESVNSPLNSFPNILTFVVTLYLTSTSPKEFFTFFWLKCSVVITWFLKCL